ncbi:bifunctional ADP-dependent NAD(P)H-hydrate dehydratase/NAD(P)H-hydrate epimerase [soil metagenome]
MIRGYAVEAVRAAEEQAMAGLPDGELMQRAAEGLAAVVLARAKQRRARTVVVLAGPGDNGGDALYAAAGLAAHLAVVVVGVADALHPGGERAAYQAGVVVLRADPGDEALPGEVRHALGEADVVVDGLLGIGGRPGLRGAMATLVDAVEEGSYLIAVDLPSGADPAGLEPARDAVFADETVTFGVAKPVHLLPATEAAVGRLTVVDIGLAEPDRAVVERLTHDDVSRLWPRPGAGADKYSRGVLGIVAGGERYPGAAVLCVTAAVEAGVGMARYVGPPTPTGMVLAACPEVVPGSGRVQAWVVGPGLDPEDDSEPGRAQVEAVREALGSDLPCLVDAGALRLVGRRAAPTLLTPHAGELADLLGRLEDGDAPDRAQVQAEPVRHARRAAELTGATVLLKGSRTLVVDAHPGRAVRCQADAPGWLATAGAGDVLAGLAGALLAGGLDPLDTGSLAALVHGVAADRANPGGPVRALRLARAIPGAVARLLELP